MEKEGEILLPLISQSFESRLQRTVSTARKFVARVRRVYILQSGLDVNMKEALHPPEEVVCQARNIIFS